MDKGDQMRKGTTTLAILKLLSDAGEPMHGYQIARALENRSQGYFLFKEGLIYPRLHQMEREGLLESKWEEKLSERRRKVYVPTAEGRRRLDSEMGRWTDFLRSMERLLGLGG